LEKLDRNIQLVYTTIHGKAHVAESL